MHPLRSVVLFFSKLPPLVLLVSVLGIATITTMLITGSINDRMATYDAKTKELQSQLQAKGKVVFALKDIPEGQSIPSEAIEERECEQSKIPVDALTSASLAMGRVTKYGISTNQLI